MEKGFHTKGDITQGKEDLESNVALARIAARMEISNYIRLGKGAKGLWTSGEETILADTVEALIGAIFLDSDAGFGVVKQCIGKWFESELKKPRPTKHAKKEFAVSKPVIKKLPRKADVKKPATPKTTGIERLVPRQISPLPTFPRRGVTRGMKQGPRRSSNR
jgi:ribonuclease-3